MNAPQPIDINLGNEPLRLTECLTCRALTMRDSFPAHLEWHRLRGDEVVLR